MIVNCHFLTNYTRHLIFGVSNGFLWGLVVFFTLLGVVFILKVMKGRRFNVWQSVFSEKKDIRPRGPCITKHSPPHPQNTDTTGNPPVNRTDGQPEGAVGTADAGEVLFPGQGSLAETLTLAYSEDSVDEALFSLCSEQELEEILTEVAEVPGKTSGRQSLPLSFLPVVTEEKFSMADEVSGKEGKKYPIQTGEVQKEELQDQTGEAIITPPGANNFPAPAFTIEEEETNNKVAVGSGGSSCEGVSIFEELLSKCDTEAKLILLRELPAVGDEKELALLKSMSFDENKSIRKLAGKLHRKLSLQLGSEAKSLKVVRIPTQA
jgi:hypothetical protein